MSEACSLSVLCAIYILPDSRQYIENIGIYHLTFLGIVDLAWRQEDEDSGKITF